MAKLDCFNKVQIPGLKEKFDSQVTDAMPENQQRQIAAVIAADYHKQLHTELNALKKSIGVKESKYTPVDNSEEIKKVNSDFDDKVRSVQTQKPVVKIFERPEMENHVYKVTHNGKDTFVQRQEGMNPGDTAWYEVEKKNNGWYNIDGGDRISMSKVLGYTQAEALSYIVGRSGNEAGVSDPSEISDPDAQLRDQIEFFIQFDKKRIETAKSNIKKVIEGKDKAEDMELFEELSNQFALTDRGLRENVYDVFDKLRNRYSIDGQLDIISDAQKNIKTNKENLDKINTGTTLRASDDDIDADLEDMWDSMRGRQDKPRHRVALSPIVEGDPIDNFVLRFGDRTIIQEVMKTHERRDNTYDANPSDYERQEIAIKETSVEMDNLVAGVLGTKGLGPGSLYFTGKFSDKNVPIWVKNLMMTSLTRMLQGRPDIANNLRLSYDKQLATQSALGLFSRRDFQAENEATDEQQETITNAVKDGKDIVAAKKKLKEAMDSNDIPDDVLQSFSEKTHQQATEDVEQAKAAMREKRIDKKLGKQGAKHDSATYNTKARMAEQRLKSNSKGSSKQAIIDKLKEVIKKC